MQITLTLDSDVAVLLRSAMHDTGAPIERVLNTALREGLLPSKPKGSATSEPFRQITFDMGDQLVDLTKAHPLADELGDLAWIEKMRRL